jgi:hypothetical protein
MVVNPFAYYYMCKKYHYIKITAVFISSFIVA